MVGSIDGKTVPGERGMAVNAHRSPALIKLIEQDRIEADRLRLQWGDAEEELGRIVRQCFDAECLDIAFRELTHGGSVWDDDEPYRDELVAPIHSLTLGE